MLGLSGRAFGQINTFKPDSFANQEPLGLHLDLNEDLSEHQNDYFFITNQDQSINCASKIFSGHPISSDSVQILRTQLIAHFEKGDIDEVRKFKNLLWERQHFAGENLSYPEYWLILFWTQEYDSLLDLKRQVDECSFQTTYCTTIKVFQTKLVYESFYSILQEKSLKFHRFLQDQINETTKGEDASFLLPLLDKLIKTDAWLFDDVEIFRLNYNRKFIEKPSPFGRIENDYGRIDTVLPNRFAYQDPYKLILSLDESPYSHDLSKRNFPSRTPRFRTGFGIFYQKGFYQGEISNYVHNHRALTYFSMDIAYNRFFMNLCSSEGKFDAGYLNINGDNFYQKFSYSEFSELKIILGYEVVSNSSFSIILNVGNSLKSYDFSTAKGQYSSSIRQDYITDYSLGFIADYKFVKFGKHYFNYAALRFQYDYCFGGKRNVLYHGEIHQLAIGFMISLTNGYR